MISTMRFTCVNLNQATCISTSLVQSATAVKRPTGPANAYLHRVWRADSPGEALTG